MLCSTFLSFAMQLKLNGNKRGWQKRTDTRTAIWLWLQGFYCTLLIVKMQPTATGHFFSVSFIITSYTQPRINSSVEMLDMLYLKVVDAASLVWFQNVQSFEVFSPKIVQECSRQNFHLSWRRVMEMIQNVKTFCHFEHCYANIPRLFLVHIFGKLCYYQTNTFDYVLFYYYLLKSLSWINSCISMKILLKICLSGVNDEHVQNNSLFSHVLEVLCAVHKSW